MIKRTFLVLFSLIMVFVSAQTPKIVVAAAKGDIKKVKNRIKKDGINAKSRTQWFALAYAVNRNDIEMTQMLLENNANVNLRINTKETPLLLAAKYNFNKIALLLIKNKADVQSIDIIQFTPMHWAAKNGNKQLVNLLLEAGANINATNVGGRTPLDLANSKIINYLKEKGAKKGSELL